MPQRDPTRDEIEQTLRDTRGNVRRAALLLGIDRRKFYRLCKRLGIALEGHRGGYPDPEEEED
jgi:transcriptional regulator of acetoin/glycerol metabolism